MRHLASSFRRPMFVAVLAGLMLGGTVVIAAAGTYTRLQLLLPGESAAPGTGSGKTGTPRAQTSGVPFNVTVRACDSGWNTVTGISNAIQMLSSDASATLPASSQLGNGTATVAVTFNAGGTFTLYAHDQSDATIPDGTSAPVASLVLQGFVFNANNQKNRTAGVPDNTTIRAVDPQGNTLTGYSGVVRLKETTSFGDGETIPASITLTNGQWSGGVACLRADETNVNRGNVNIYAWLESAPAKNGTSDPFLIHPGPFTRAQLLVPGESPLPGSTLGKSGTPATQGAGRGFPVSVYATDSYWNPVASGDNVRISSNDPAANTPVSGTLSGGFRQFNIILNTIGTRTLTVSDLTNAGIQGMTSPGIAVIPSAVDHFVVESIASPQVAGVPVSVTIRATDASGNTILGYAAEANLAANTGAGSITPERVNFANGIWAGPMTFKGAGGAVSFSCTDFSAPPHTGSSNGFTVAPGPLAGMQVILPGETPQGGTNDGKNGTPSPQSAGNPFTITVRAVDAYWNLVPGVNDRIALGSTDAFAAMPAETTLSNGQRLIPVRLYRTGAQRIWASDLDLVTLEPDTSSAVMLSGGPFARVLVLAPGESPAPGTQSGRTGTATDQSINYAFTVTLLATDAWWNPVKGVSDVVHLASDDPLATLPADAPLVDGSAQMSRRLARGGYNQILVSDVTQPSKSGSSTQVRAITSGFHLEASVSPASARAGEPFTFTVKVTNDAGSVIQEINSFVTLEVRNASSRNAGRGTLLTTQFQLLQGQRSVSETYTFVEPIVIIARDDAGNAPATSNVITITPGTPTAIQLVSAPAWVGGNKHAQIRARLVDAYDNGVAGVPMTFAHLSGIGVLTPVDSLTDSTGVSRADFLSSRQPGSDLLRASASGLIADLTLQTAFVDPNAAGGTVTNYPNPFHPSEQSTVIAWKLDDNAMVTLRIFTQSGDLVLSRTFERGSTGGSTGLNEFAWDGRNGRGDLVASGGYVALVEAHGTGETLHVMRRKLAAVR
ncbi:MAG: FlgD immunoglobulin-like domain containing protein [Candidatus Eisenbacteria bacterium]